MSASQKKNEALKVILDSNALFVPLEFKIDIFCEVERLLNRNVNFVLLSPIKRELETSSRQKIFKNSHGSYIRFKACRKMQICCH